MEKLVIIGAGGLGREVAWIVQRINSSEPAFEVLGFLDDDSDLPCKCIDGIPILGNTSAIPEHVSVICAIGNNRIRHEMTLKLAGNGIKLATVIDPSASIAPTAVIGEGSYIGIGAIVSAGTSLGRSTIVNHNACIGHDVNAADACQFCPGCCISGSCSFGERAMVATLAGIIPGKKIGTDAMIGAGIVAYRDLDDGAVLVSTAGIRQSRI